MDSATQCGLHEAPDAARDAHVSVERAGTGDARSQVPMARRVWGRASVCLRRALSGGWDACRLCLLPLVLACHLCGDDGGGGDDGGDATRSAERGFLSPPFPFPPLAALLLLALLSVVATLYRCQDQLLFFPEQPASSRVFVPLPLGVPREGVRVRARDGVALSAVFLRACDIVGGPAAPAGIPTFIYFHGNAGNLGHRMPNALMMVAHLRVNVLLLDYRGYGHSDGEPSEHGLYLDAQAALAHAMARPDVDPSCVVLFGRSLGGAVAIDLAARQQQQPDGDDGGGDGNGRLHHHHRRRLHGALALIVENTFLSIPHMAQALFPVFSRGGSGSSSSSCRPFPLPSWCFRSRFPSHENIVSCRVPTLFVSGLADSLVPPVMMSRLHDLSPAPLKRMATFREGTHNDTWQCRGYISALQHFLREVLAERSEAPSAPGARDLGNVSTNSIGGGGGGTFGLSADALGADLFAPASSARRSFSHQHSQQTNATLI
ncbi:unnamed protein product [Lampetra fluviatilis]